MSVFRNNGGDEEDFFDEKEIRADRRRHHPKEFRDLAPQNKKRRKEPPKPWGKKERLLVFGVLLLTIITSAVLAFSVSGWKLPNLPRLKLPSFDILKEETIVIEKNTEEKRLKANGVIQKFEEATKGLSGVYGLYVLELNSGFSYGIYEDEDFEPASLNKLPVMVGMYMESEKGSLDLDTHYILKASDKVAGSGSLYGKPAGTTLTYRDLLRYMGKESDNTAVNIARNLLGKEKIESIVQRIGMTDTSVLGDNQHTTPHDIGVLFKELWQGQLISETDRDELLEFMTDTIYENWLAAGVPREVRVAHKYGREVRVVNDAGIVFKDNPYVVVILSKGVNEREADEVFPTLSRIVYEGQSS
jgi:beta-lactamase class A